MGIIKVFIFLSYFQNVWGGEPTCYSRFDYDEKMLMKLLKIEDKVEKFEELVTDIKANHDRETNERRRVFETELEELRIINAEELERQRNLTAEIQQTVDDAKAQLAAFLKHLELQQQQQQQQAQAGKVIAFTVTTPSIGEASDSLSFTSVVTNKGDGFDTSTGKFTVQVAGLYYFSLHLTKKRSGSVDVAGCYLRQNGQDKVRAYIDPQDGTTGADNGSYGLSTSVYLDLTVGDVITVAGCSGSAVAALESWSTLSGYLVKPAA